MGVTVHHIDVLDGYAQAIRHELRERGLVPLSVAVRPGEDRNRARRVNANGTHLE